MVDSETYYKSESPHLTPKIGNVPNGVPMGVSQCLCSVCLKYNTGASKRKTSIFDGYNDIYPERTDELTAHQYLICSAFVMAFITEARCWGKWIAYAQSSKTYHEEKADSISNQKAYMLLASRTLNSTQA